MSSLQLGPGTRPHHRAPGCQPSTCHRPAGLWFVTELTPPHSKEVAWLRLQPHLMQSPGLFSIKVLEGSNFSTVPTQLGSVYCQDFLCGGGAHKFE